MATVLIADDSMFMRKRLSDILTGEGHVVIAEAENGEEAIQFYRQMLLRARDARHHDARAQRHGRPQPHHDPQPRAVVIMCSALGEETVVQECLDTGAKAFVIKPFDPPEVLDAVGKALE